VRLLVDCEVCAKVEVVLSALIVRFTNGIIAFLFGSHLYSVSLIISYKGFPRSSPILLFGNPLIQDQAGPFRVRDWSKSKTTPLL
jgi:hypothetical protein